MSAVGISSNVKKEQPMRVQGPVLAGWQRMAALGAWLAIYLLSLAAFFAAIVVWYRWDSTPAALLIQNYPKVTSQIQAFYVQYQAGIYQLGLSLFSYAGLFAVLRLLAGIPYFVLSLLIVQRRSDRLMAVLFAIFLPAAGAAGRWISANWNALPGLYPGWDYPIRLLSFILDLGVILFYTFPDGRFVPRWTRWFAFAVVVFNFLRDLLLGSSVDANLLSGFWGQLPLRIFVLVGIIALVYRYRKDADTVQKQQIKWMVFGASLLVLLFFAHFVVYQLYPMLAGRDLLQTPEQNLIAELILEPAWYVAQFLFAICIGLAVFRYHLWDIDLVINRVLVYGSLTLLTMGIYLMIVAVLGSFFHNLGGPPVFFLATGLVAILFEPLRRRLQRAVNRLMYGERDDPYTVLTRLSSVLEHALTPGELLPAITSVIGQALKIPYVAIQVNQNGENQVVARYGETQPGCLAFPLVYQGETVGGLLVAQRAPGEEFSSADRSLIENISRQASAAAQAVRLNEELIRSRAEIVLAREEERRRLRRDLHDGLGPVLASQTLKMAAARELVRKSPERAESMLNDVIQRNENTVTEVRRLVYGLRPPALDELGLVEAVRDLLRISLDGHSADSGLEIQVSGPEGGLPDLPAAVETNAYRIALEGLTNVARHAKAHHCSIQFGMEADPKLGDGKQALSVQIDDDGIGIPNGYQPGVGLRSMRERAEELGGALRIESLQPQGTHITAWLPITGNNHRGNDDSTDDH